MTLCADLKMSKKCKTLAYAQVEPQPWHVDVDAAQGVAAAAALPINVSNRFGKRILVAPHFITLCADLNM